MSARLKVRVVSANVQSFPRSALSELQALDDLVRNAGCGDLVFLQEIAEHYRPLVAQAFPSAGWEVYYGPDDNQTPIAWRRDAFTPLDQDTSLLHPANSRHARRYITHVRLRVTDLGCDLHATNLHLVSGAFNDTPLPDKAARVAEWHEGMARHTACVEEYVREGLPVVGGGDYNRQLKRHKCLGSRIAGKPVAYGVDPSSIDLIWFVDGDQVAWDLRSTRLYPGRNSTRPARHSDHAARRAKVTLTPVSVAPEPPDPRPGPDPGRPPRPSPDLRPDPPPARPPRERARPMPGPFELTTFGDVGPKRVDWKTRAALAEAERRLGYPLTIVQGSYNRGGVAASGGTHDGGGVVDLKSWDWQRKVRVLRSIGFAAWYRPTVSGLWGAHIHAVLIDHGRLSSSAANQVAAYRAGRDGLRSNAPDTFWRPSPVPVFAYPPTTRPTDEAVDTSAGTRGGGRPGAHPAPYPPRRTLDGVDTSHYQSGRLDLKAAQRAGLRWWYLKATEGTTLTDSTYRARLRAARKAGIPVGAYHFARPDRGDAVDEAMFFLRHTDIRAGDMLPMLDLESLEGLSLPEVTDWVGVWVATIRTELGQRGLSAKPIIYTPFNLEKGFGCLLWVARYSDDFRPPVIPRPWRRAAIWQHSNGRFGPIKQVPGFGPVDVNAVHPDLPLSALRVKAGRPPRPPVPPPPPPPPTDDESRPDAPVDLDLADLRDELERAARNIRSALERLPEG
ncbi:GH25 family lysozyme [Nocardioides sp.]|uniref:GH25 family lysozyme n=1 Tax=Nocardioides sp. TaxID=35761 RepID=UPI003569AB91